MGTVSVQHLHIRTGRTVRYIQASPGGAIAFLIAGPITTIPAMAAVWAVVRPRVFALYVGVGLRGATLLVLLTDVLL